MKQNITENFTAVFIFAVHYNNQITLFNLKFQFSINDNCKKHSFYRVIQSSRHCKIHEPNHVINNKLSNYKILLILIKPPKFCFHNSIIFRILSNKHQNKSQAKYE